MFKKLLAFVITSLLVVSMLSLSVFAKSTDIKSGKTGDCTWTLEGTVLTISGNGKMGDHEYPEAPWSNVVTKVIVDNGVTNIGNDSFACCKGLSSITLPDSITSIGERAFYGCAGIKQITIPKYVTQIGIQAFQNCTGLTSITIPENVATIGRWGVFAGCANLEKISVDENNATYHSDGNCLIKTETKELLAGCKNSVIPSDGSVTSIGYYAFYDCTSLTNIDIPNSVTSIGEFAFNGCTGLTSIAIPDSVTNIGEYAFLYCSGLTSVYITDITAWCNISFISFASNPLYYAKALYLNGELVTKLVIPDSVTSIGRCAFNGCARLASITIPNSVTSIGADAFSYCTGLTSITIPNSVTSIGAYAFSGCKGLTSLTIGNSVTRIGDRAFDGLRESYKYNHTRQRHKYR